MKTLFAIFRANASINDALEFIPRQRRYEIVLCQRPWWREQNFDRFPSKRSNLRASKRRITLTIGSVQPNVIDLVFRNRNHPFTFDACSLKRRTKKKERKKDGCFSRDSSENNTASHRWKTIVAITKSLFPITSEIRRKLAGWRLAYQAIYFQDGTEIFEWQSEIPFHWCTWFPLFLVFLSFALCSNPFTIMGIRVRGIKAGKRRNGY